MAHQARGGAPRTGRPAVLRAGGEPALAMSRNDARLPFWALVVALASGWAAYLDGQRLAGGHAAEPLSVGQIGLVTFGLVLAVYGVIGLVSIWLEGTEFHPGRHPAAPGPAAIAVCGAVALALAAASGLFVHDIVQSLQTEQVHPPQEGLLFGAMAILSAVLLVFYKKYAVGEEVITEDEHSEVPW